MSLNTGVFSQEATLLTQISVVRITKLPPTTEAKVKGQLIGLSQLPAVINGCERILCAVESHKAVVVAVGTNHGFMLMRFNK